MTFYGWRIVLVAVVAQALGTGLLGIYAFAATPIVREFGATDAEVGFGISIFILCMALAAPLLGTAVDRGPIRAIMLCGVALMLGSAWLLSRSVALWQLGALFALASIGIAMYGHLPVTVLLVNWFVARRGLALAAGAAGLNVAGFFVPPLSAWLIESFGWRHAVALLATGAASIAFPAIALLVVKRPEDLGQRPDGRPAPGAAPAAGPPLERGAREVLADPNFWLIGIGVSIALCVPVSSLFFVRHMESLGFEPQRISLLIASMAVLGLIGKLLAGSLCDRMDQRLVAIGVLLADGAGWVLLAMGSSVQAMLLACAIIGLGGGALIPLPPVLVGACFGRGLVGRVAGLHAPLGLPFLLAAAPLVGFARDRTGDYVAPFLGLAGALGLAALILSFVRIPEREPGGAPPVPRWGSPRSRGAVYCDPDRQPGGGRP